MTRTLVALALLALSPLAFAADSVIPEASGPFAVEAAPLQAAVVLDRAQVERQLRDRRAAGIRHLLEYSARGEFPIAPVGEEGLVHMFLDQNGTPCAVASMIIASGHRDLVEQTAQVNNTVVLSDVTEGPLLDWMLGSGFTREEIAIIQLPDWRPDRVMFLPPDTERVQRHLAAVLPLLEADQDTSIRKAVDRLMVRPQAAIAAL